jgi:predicted nucleic acid-binding protein
VIVIDTNVLAYFLIEGPQSATARHIMAADREWRIPELWKHEFLNILASYVRGGMDLNEALQIWREANYLMRDAAQPVNMATALGIAARYKLSGYDAEFITLADALGVPCITADRKLAMSVPHLARLME